MIYPALSKKLWEQSAPTVIYIAGASGKSMAMNAIQLATRHLPEQVVLLPGVTDLAKDAVGLQKRGLVGALWAYMRKQPYPGVLCVEMHPGMNTAHAARLWPLAKKTVVVLCPFTHTGQETRKEIEAYVKQELALFLDEAKNVHIVYNADVPHITDVISDLGFGEQTSIGIQSVADIQALTVDVLAGDPVAMDGRWAGVHAKVRIGGSTLPFLAHGGVGQTHVRPAMYAVAVAQVLGVNAIDALQSLRSYSPLPGRMTLIPGIKKTMLVDDSYDSDLDSVVHALRDVAQLPLPKEQKRWAMLGELADTGAESEEMHASVGELVSTLGFSALVAVGEKAADIARGAIRGGMDQSAIFHFGDKDEAGKFVQRMMKKGDLVFIKGAASQKCETIVKELMAFPLKAKTDLLQR